jgi:hypothetical protein
MEILNKEKDGVLKYKDQVSPQTINDVFACYYFFSTYQAELEGINKEYYKLYDAVYHSTDEGYAKRAKSETASLFDVYATKIWEILDFEVRPKARLKRIEFQFPSPRQINNKSIDNLKVSILQTVQKIAPDLTEEEFQEIAVACDAVSKKCKWDKIYLLCPNGTFVDDHTRYMACSGMNERNELFEILCNNIKASGNWDKVVILNGGYWNNFQKILNDVKEIMER